MKALDGKKKRLLQWPLLPKTGAALTSSTAFASPAERLPGNMVPDWRSPALLEQKSMPIFAKAPCCLELFGCCCWDSRPDGSVGMALVLPALTDCRWWFEFLLVHSGVSSATRWKATGADQKKWVLLLRHCWRDVFFLRLPWQRIVSSRLGVALLSFVLVSWCVVCFWAPSPP